MTDNADKQIRRAFTAHEQWMLGALYIAPGMTWRAWVSAAHMNSQRAREACDALIRDGYVREVKLISINARDQRRKVTAYEIVPGRHPWFAAYRAWVESDRTLPPPVPDRPKGFFARLPDSPSEDDVRLPPGKATSARARVLEAFLRNPGQPWRVLKLVCRLPLKEATLAKEALCNDNVLLPIVDRHVDRYDRTIPRQIFVTDEGNAEVQDIRKRYGLKRVPSPPAYEAWLRANGCIAWSDKDVSIPAFLVKDETIRVVEPARAPELAVQASEITSLLPGSEAATPIYDPNLGPAFMSEEWLAQNKQEKPHVGGFLASLDQPAAETFLERMDRATREAAQSQPMVERAVSSVSDQHDVMPEAPEESETPEEEALGFTSWTFPDAE